MGCFVKHLVSTIPQNLISLFVVNGPSLGSPKVCIVDQGILSPSPTDSFIAVYSRNRTFRLWLSSKLGKEAFFMPADEDTKQLLLDEGPYKFFLYSLLCAPILPEDNGVASSNGKVTEKHLSFSSESNTDHISHDGSFSTFRRQHVFGYLSSLFPVSTAGQKSPFPLLDDFLLKKANDDMSNGKQITIRKCIVGVHLDSGMMKVLLTYDLMGYRFCDHINRAHRSNHVKLHVFIEGLWKAFANLVSSTLNSLSPMLNTPLPFISASCARWCLDPLCRDMTSNAKKEALNVSLLNATTPELLMPLLTRLLNIESNLLCGLESDPFLIDGDDVLSIDTNI